MTPARGGHLVLLHGFLGTPTEWLALRDQLPPALQARCHALALPGHLGGPAATGFTGVNAWLDQTLLELGIQDCVLYGYSLGGRLALGYARYSQARQAQQLHTAEAPGLASPRALTAAPRYPRLHGLILEGANPGLADSDLITRQQRARQDADWVHRLRREPLPHVLDAWYRQAVFADLHDAQRHELVALRSRQPARQLARMLAATSLARQPDMLPWLQQGHLPVLYLYGSQDPRFAAVAGRLAACPHLQCARIEGGGHNLHLLRADAIARLLPGWLHTHLPPTLFPLSQD